MVVRILSTFLLVVVTVCHASYIGNHALHFDGKDDTILVLLMSQDLDLPDGSWTVEAWVKPDRDAQFDQENN